MSWERHMFFMAIVDSSRGKIMDKQNRFKNLYLFRERAPDFESDIYKK